MINFVRGTGVIRVVFDSPVLNDLKLSWWRWTDTNGEDRWSMFRDGKVDDMLLPLAAEDANLLQRMRESTMYWLKYRLVFPLLVEAGVEELEYVPPGAKDWAAEGWLDFKYSSIDN